MRRPGELYNDHQNAHVFLGQILVAEPIEDEGGTSIRTPPLPVPERGSLLND